MSRRIDQELEHLSKAGQTPRQIHVGWDLYWELEAETSSVSVAPLVEFGPQAPVDTLSDVTKYKGISVVRIDDVPTDYLKILI